MNQIGIQETVYPVSFETQQSGQIVKSTCYDYIWKLKMGQEEYKVEFKLNTMIGSKTIYVNGVQAASSAGITDFFTDEVTIDFKMGSMPCQVSWVEALKTYDLILDGKSFKELLDNSKQSFRLECS